jgi:hypothetical protein
MNYKQGAITNGYSEENKLTSGIKDLDLEDHELNGSEFTPDQNSVYDTPTNFPSSAALGLEVNKNNSTNGTQPEPSPLDLIASFQSLNLARLNPVSRALFQRIGDKVVALLPRKHEPTQWRFSDGQLEQIMSDISRAKQEAVHHQEKELLKVLKPIEQAVMAFMQALKAMDAFKKACEDFKWKLECFALEDDRMMEE